MKKKSKDVISLIVPCYNEEESLDMFYKTFKNFTSEMDYVNWEVIFVDDGSRDKTLEILRKIALKDQNIRYISFAKNFGKEYAMIAGLDACKGDYAAVIDADLQHPITLLKKMYDLVSTGKCDCAAARSKKRNYNFLRKFLTNIYYKLINAITEVEMKSNATDYRLMNRKMLNAILELREHNRYLKGIYEVVGFETIWIDYEDNERIAGTSKFNIIKLFKYAMTGLISFSQFPLVFLFYMGILFFILALLLSIIILILFLLNINLKFIIWLIIIGFLLIISTILISNGIIGLYIAQIQTESKNRPLYIIKEDNLNK